MEHFTFSVIIPVFNEKATILDILRKIEKVNLKEIGVFRKDVIIVDDGSTDGTTEILKRLGSKYKVIYHNENRGKGSAIKTALAEVSSDYLIIQDADLEYNPEDFIKLFQPVSEKDALVVFGSRWLNPKNAHIYKLFYLGGVFLTFLTNFLYKQKLTDVLTCYKLFKTDVLKKINLESSGFEFCCEATSKVLNRKIQIFEVPISYFPRKKKMLKRINFLDGLKMIFVLIGCRLKK